MNVYFRSVKHFAKTQENMTSLVQQILQGLILYMLKRILLNMESLMIIVKERTAVFLQLMSTQETEFPCDSTEFKYSSRRCPLSNEDTVSV